MKTIELTQGQVALVDDSDFDWFNQWKWTALKNYWYGFRAVRHCRCPFSKKTYAILMHRQIMSCPPDKEIDHRDHNILNNQRFNLRICTTAENQRNSKIRKDNTSGFKGVHWSKREEKWRAQIRFNGQRIHLGDFVSKIEAAKAYDQAARKYFGEFALTNF